MGTVDLRRPPLHLGLGGPLWPGLLENSGVVQLENFYTKFPADSVTTEKQRAQRRACRKAAKLRDPAGFRARHNKGNLLGQRRRRLLRKYGLTLPAFEALWAAQGGLCAICRTALKRGQGTHVDHDHGTGAVRGLLCSNCNTGIGQLGDSVAGVRAALRYLESQPDRLALVG